jgi:hypothetical protein
MHTKEQLHDLYSLLNVAKVMKSRRMRLPGHVARMGTIRNAYRMLFLKCEWEVCDPLRYDAVLFDR